MFKKSLRTRRLFFAKRGDRMRRLDKAVYGCYNLTVRRNFQKEDLRWSSSIIPQQIAELLNMQLTVYQRYERGERELPLWAAIKLADYYDITLDYLVGREVK